MHLRTLFKKSADSITTFGLDLHAPPRLLGLKKRNTDWIISHLSSAANLSALPAPQSKLPVTIALTDQQIISKQISLPASLTTADIEILLNTEAARFFPNTSSALSIDFRCLGIDLTQPAQQQVIAIAAPRSLIMQLTQQVEAQDFSVTGIDIESYALIRTIRECYPVADDFLLVQLEQTTSCLMLYKNRCCVFYQQEIFTETPLVKLQQQIQLLKLNFSLANIQQCYLVGSYPGLALLCDEIATQFNLLTFLLDAITEKTAKPVSGLAGASYSLAYGLAQRSINNAPV